MCSNRQSGPTERREPPTPEPVGGELVPAFFSPVLASCDISSDSIDPAAIQEKKRSILWILRLLIR